MYIVSGEYQRFDNVCFFSIHINSKEDLAYPGKIIDKIQNVHNLMDYDIIYYKIQNVIKVE